jgi:hypothetical protein
MSKLCGSHVARAGSNTWGPIYLVGTLTSLYLAWSGNLRNALEFLSIGRR